MAVIQKWIYKGIVMSVPFCFLFIFQLQAQSEGVAIHWEDMKAKAVSIPLKEDYTTLKDIRISLQGKNSAILGSVKSNKGKIEFTPPVPFTYGLSYEVFYKESKISEFHIATPTNLNQSKVLNVFPGTKSVPSNLLKIHIQFSKPMQEGFSQQNVYVTNAQGDTVPGVFLDLQPELWNEDQTRLTLWLDPGRIKRDLQPNLKLGTPLEKGSVYNVIISKAWRDQLGLPLSEDFKIQYEVSEADRTKPDPKNWEISYPRIGTRDKLNIDFGETVDFELASNAITVYRKNYPVRGSILLEKQESQWIFTPESIWIPGAYLIRIESRLDDLAGNNLNRLFDRDLAKESALVSESAFKEIPFILKEDSVQ